MLFGLRLRFYPSFPDGIFSYGETLEQRQALLHFFEITDVDQISGGLPVLGDQNRVLIFAQIRNDFCRVPLQRRDEFGFHEYH